MNTKSLEAMLRHPIVTQKETQVYYLEGTEIIERVDVLIDGRWVSYENDELTDELSDLYWAEDAYREAERLWQE